MVAASGGAGWSPRMDAYSALAASSRSGTASAERAIPASRMPYTSTGRVTRPAYFPGNGRAQGQPAHVGGQNRGDGEFACAEDQRELPEPRGLVQERGENPKGKNRL